MFKPRAACESFAFQPVPKEYLFLGVLLVNEEWTMGHSSRGFGQLDGWAYTDGDLCMTMYRWCCREGKDFQILTMFQLIGHVTLYANRAVTVALCLCLSTISHRCVFVLLGQTRPLNPRSILSSMAPASSSALLLEVLVIMTTNNHPVSATPLLCEVKNTPHAICPWFPQNEQDEKNPTQGTDIEPRKGYMIQQRSLS